MRTTASAAGAAGSHGAHGTQGSHDVHDVHDVHGAQGSHGTLGTLDAPQASSPAGAEDTADPAGTARLYEWLAALADAELPQSDTALIDHIRALEELKSACAAVQARAAATFDASQRQAQARAGIPPAQLGRGIGAQIALARRDSPHRGGRHLGLGKALVHEMPHTLTALSTGVLSEWRATLLVRETACLEVEDRRRVDALVCGNPAALEGVGDRKLIARIRSLTQAIDPASQVRRHAKAVADRYVSCRPAPDTMSYLTGLLPVAQGVAVFTALSRTADSLRSSGDERGRGQIMADTLVERITGQATAAQVPVQVQLVMTDRTLFPSAFEPGPPNPRHLETAEAKSGNISAAPSEAGDGNGAKAGAGDEPAYFPGYGIVPGQWARDLITDALRGQGPDLAADNHPPEQHISSGDRIPSVRYNPPEQPNPSVHRMPSDRHNPPGDPIPPYRNNPPEQHIPLRDCIPSGHGVPPVRNNPPEQPNPPERHIPPGIHRTPLTGNTPDRDQDPDLDLDPHVNPREIRPQQQEQGRRQARTDAVGPDPTGRDARDAAGNQDLPAPNGNQDLPASNGRDANDESRNQARVTLRRLFLDPESRELIAMDSKARYFPPGLARLIRTRDQTCRTPWCDAPIRHIDHIRPYSEAGPTSYTNGQGLCEACNHAKEAPGWTAESTCIPGQRHAVRTVTPTGHAYRSTAPPLPGAPPTQ